MGNRRHYYCRKTEPYGRWNCFWGGGISVITITLTDADGGGYDASTETSYADALSAMISGAVIFKLAYLTQTYDVFGMVDYDPEEPDYSGITIVDNFNLYITISWGNSSITVESNSGGN